MYTILLLIYFHTHSGYLNIGSQVIGHYDTLEKCQFVARQLEDSYVKPRCVYEGEKK